MRVYSIEIKFNYGLSRVQPVSIFVRFAYPEEKAIDYEIETLLTELKTIQDANKCYDVILCGNFSDFLEEIYWVFSRLIENGRCILTILVSSEIQVMSLNPKELPSAMYAFLLTDMSNAILKSYIDFWLKLNISENDLIIINEDNFLKLMSIKGLIQRKEIKAPLAFNASKLDAKGLIEGNCLDITPIFWKEIWK